MSQPDYNFDKVNRASQACGPLVKWAIAQVTHRFPFSNSLVVGNVNLLLYTNEERSDQRWSGAYCRLPFLSVSVKAFSLK